MNTIELCKRQRGLALVHTVVRAAIANPVLGTGDYGIVAEISLHAIHKPGGITGNK